MSKPRTVVLALFLLALLLVVPLACWADREVPEATAGPEAEAMTDRMLAAIDADAWARTGAVRWIFRGKQEHLWDRSRNLARVRFDGVEVLVDLASKRGLATRDGTSVDASETAELVEQAWAHWANDSFWLNPIAKLRDEGTTRGVVAPDPKGRPRLLVCYESGGVTPGDCYLWIVGDDDRPVAWRMWVKIIPGGGTRATWDGWQRLDTGAWVATQHRIARLLTLRLTEIEGAATLAALEPGPDPFAALVGAETAPAD